MFQIHRNNKKILLWKCSASITCVLLKAGLGKNVLEKKLFKQ